MPKPQKADITNTQVTDVTENPENEILEGEAEPEKNFIDDLFKDDIGKANKEAESIKSPLAKNIEQPPQLEKPAEESKTAEAEREETIATLQEVLEACGDAETIEIGGKTIARAELQDALDATMNRRKWSKANTEEAQRIAKERDALLSASPMFKRILEDGKARRMAEYGIELLDKPRSAVAPERGDLGLELEPDIASTEGGLRAEINNMRSELNAMKQGHEAMTKEREVEKARQIEARMNQVVMAARNHAKELGDIWTAKVQDDFLDRLERVNDVRVLTMGDIEDAYYLALRPQQLARTAAKTRDAERKGKPVSPPIIRSGSPKEIPSHKVQFVTSPEAKALMEGLGTKPDDVLKYVPDQ